MNRKPTDTAQKIFEFIKLPFGETIKNWISRNTGRTSRRRRTAAKFSDFHFVEKRKYSDKDVFIYEDGKGNRRSKVSYHSDAIRPNPPAASKSGTSARHRAGSRPRVPSAFSTSRKASDVLEKWPDELPYEVVKGIDEGCDRLLQTFGYKMVGTEIEYGDKTISYLPELPKTEFANNDTLSDT